MRIKWACQFSSQKPKPCSSLTINMSLLSVVQAGLVIINLPLDILHVSHAGRWKKSDQKTIPAQKHYNYFYFWLNYELGTLSILKIIFYSGLPSICYIQLTRHMPILKKILLLEMRGYKKITIYHNKYSSKGGSKLFMCIGTL